MSQPRLTLRRKPPPWEHEAYFEAIDPERAAAALADARAAEGKLTSGGATFRGVWLRYQKAASFGSEDALNWLRAEGLRSAPEEAANWHGANHIANSPAPDEPQSHTLHDLADE
ncbi:hypothetical protein [Variovorax sp. YR566]|uniref:hypothetical protein n=1 Tax=Variovorax sp. YR566 TaxID=3450237 RepID=UPI003F7CFCB2